jgi:hypothetical protein
MSLPAPPIRVRPLSFAAIAALAALLCALAAAAALSAGEAPKPRAFSMGFTPFPYDLSLEAVGSTDRFIVKHGDLVVQHLDNGVPWTQCLEGKAPHKAVQEDWARRRSLCQGRKVLLAVTPLDGGRKGLALYRGSGENMPLPEAFRGKALDDPLVKKAFLAWCRRAVEQFRPDWLAIAIEANELIVNSPEKWPGFLALYRETRAALKKDRPSLPICATISLHALTDPAKKDKNGQRDKVRELLEDCDVAGISYHPFLAGNMKHPEEALEWLRGFTKKPIAIAETSFPAETIRLKTFGLTLEADPGLQAAYMEKLLARADADGYLFVTWYLHRDYDAMWEKIRLTAPEYFIVWKDCGLLDEEGKERPAMGLWKEALARPATGRRR